MTGGWAATNTLRVNAQHFLEGVGALIPGAKVEHSEDCPGCKQEAALALVEAALEAAEKAEGYWDAGDEHSLDSAMVALAAALRAVREGK